MSVLILIGALIACTDAKTPFPAPPTLTLIPGTVTVIATNNLLNPTAEVIETQPLPTLQAEQPGIETILESSVTPDIDLTRRVLRSLANELNISMDRIQIVMIEDTEWYDDHLGCDLQADLELDNVVATFQPDEPIAGYRYILLVGNITHEVHTRGVGMFIRCDASVPIRDELLLAVDPVAYDIVQLVKRLVAADLDLSTRRIQLEEITAYVWLDTSLGCPFPDQIYTPATVPGYRIVVRVGTNTLAFHSDAVSVFPCPHGQELLPD